MSASNVSRRRGTILDEIMKYHRGRLPQVMREVPLADLRALASVAPPPLDMVATLKLPDVSLIAECKKASPSKGLLVPHYDPAGLALRYVEAGASAISVLTDGRHFQGSLEHLRDVKETVSSLCSPDTGQRVPVLRKDFIFHPYQVYESRAAGADALLLIVSVLGDNDLKSLLDLTRSLGMDALVEVHTRAELERALPLGPRLIGVNNRDLRTFEVDFQNTARLREMIPEHIAMVAESGVKTAEDVRRMADIGVDAVLVGEALVKSKDILKTTRAFVAAGCS